MAAGRPESSRTWFRLLVMIYDEFSFSDINEQEWAVSDTVQWRFQSGEENEHKVAVFFLDSARSWIRYLANKDEL